jgi:hypothetical protein
MGLGVSGAVAQSQVPESPTQLSEDVRDALDEAFDEWRVPDSIRTDRSCRPPATVPASPFVTGDFDGDQLRDIALYVEANGATRLAVALNRMGWFQVFALDLPAGSSLPILEVQPRSTRYTDPTSAVEHHLSTDTPVVEHCGAGRTLYRWRGFRFDRLDLPVSPAS